MRTWDRWSLAIGVLLVVLVGLVAANLLGLLGTHEHADLEVYLNSSEPYDFSPERYQLAADEIHLEEGDADADGATIHMHAEELTLADFFASIGWEVDEDAIRTDEGEVYAADANHTLTVTKDGEPASFQAPLEDGASYTVRYAYEPADG